MGTMAYSLTAKTRKEFPSVFLLLERQDEKRPRKSFSPLINLTVELVTNRVLAGHCPGSATEICLRHTDSTVFV